jgi:hypothetical protein
VWAAITTGYPNLAAATMPATSHRTWAVLHRASIVLAYLKILPNGRIVRSTDYDQADRNEKGSISYYLGLFGAKLGAELLLRTPWLWHYDAYHRLAHGVGPIARRPDLIGQATTGEWVVVEAKGRTNGRTDELRASAKTQAKSIGSIVHFGRATDAVDANVSSITYFDGDGWNLLMDDPPARSRPLRLAAPVSELYRAYYGPLLDFVASDLQINRSETVAIDDVEFEAVYDPDLDIYVGLAAVVIESAGTDVARIQASLAGMLIQRDDQSAVVRRHRDGAGRARSVGADGVAVRLGERWD